MSPPDLRQRPASSPLGAASRPQPAHGQAVPPRAVRSMDGRDRSHAIHRCPAPVHPGQFRPLLGTGAADRSQSSSQRAPPQGRLRVPHPWPDRKEVGAFLVRPTAALDAGVPLRNVQQATSPIVRTTMRYDRGRVRPIATPPTWWRPSWLARPASPRSPTSYLQASPTTDAPARAGRSNDDFRAGAMTVRLNVRTEPRDNGTDAARCMAPGRAPNAPEFRRARQPAITGIRVDGSLRQLP